MGKTMSALRLLAAVGLACVASASPAFAQTGSVTGRITDAETGAPLSGVQVYVRGLEIGTLSQANGRYLFTAVPAGQQEVVAERIGYGSQSLVITVQEGSPTILDFALSSEAVALDEIVVTGTAGGTQRRALGNQVARVDVSAIQQVTASNSVQEVLTGRVPGLYLNQSSGQVGLNGAPIRIRGVSSIGVGNDPLVYVDGIRINSDVQGHGYARVTSRLNDIDPNDIESIEVIKGPAAATLYGTEASNGVIQIITKRGATGAPSFQASVQLGANWFDSPRETIPRAWGILPSTGELGSVILYDHESDYLGHDLFQYGPIRRFNASVSGGTDLIRYYGSLRHSYEEGFVDWNYDEQLSGRTSITVTASDHLNITANAFFLNGDTRGSGGFHDIWGEFMRQRVSTLDNPDRRGFDVPPEEYRTGRFSTYPINRNSWDIRLEYQPTEWLQSRLTVGTDRSTAESIDLNVREPNAPYGYFRADGLGQKSINTDKTILNSVDWSLSASYQLSQSIGTRTSVGVQYTDKELTATSLLGEEFATAALRTIGAAARTSSNETFLENKTFGTYVQEEFNKDQRMFLTLAVRADDNSAFGSNFDLAIYPKVSGAWVLNEESFWTLDWINPFRVRAAWGKAGQQPDVFAATRLYQTETGPNSVPILSPRSYGNPDLGPETGSEIEVGFDAGFLDGRLQMEFTQYWKTTEDAIVPRPVAESTGFPGTQFVNAGRIKNWGTELGVSFDAVTQGPVRWDLSLALSRMGNEAVDLGGERILVNGRSDQYHVEGYPLGGIWFKRVVSADFISGNSGSVTNAMCDSGTGPDNALPGGAPVPCDDAPALYYGRAGDPTWIANLGSTLSFFDNWRLYASIDGRGGGAQADQDMMAALTTWANTKIVFTQDNPIYMAQRTVDRVPLGTFDSGFLKLREVSLEYSVPNTFASRWGLDLLTLKASVYNVSYLWKEQDRYPITGQPVPSPERSIGSNDFAGHSHTTNPPLQRATFTVNVGW